MIKWDNFYFWASLILLGACYYLIFFLYKEKFLFLNSIDAETIFLVTGTLGGAFLGAYFASRFSTNQVTRQLQHQKDMEQENRLENELKYSSTSLAILISCRNYLELLKSNLENESAWGKLNELLENANHVLRRDIEDIKAINPIATLSFEIYQHVSPSLIMIEEVLDSINGFYKHSKKSLSLTDLVDSKDLEDEIENTIYKFHQNILNIISEIEKNVELKALVSQRLKNL